MKKLLVIFLPLAIIGAIGVLVLVARTPVVGDPPALPAEATLDPFVADAIQSARQAAVDAPADGDRRGELAMTFHAHGLLDEADLTYRQAQNLDPGEPRWAYQRARIAEARSASDQAITHLEAVLRLEPNAAHALTRLGNLRLDVGDVAAARGHFERALAARANDPAAIVGLARADLQSGQSAEAARRLELLVETYPGTPYFHLLLGNAYQRLGRPDEATRQLARASGGQPDYDDPWAEQVTARKTGFATMLEEAARLIGRNQGAEALTLLGRLREIRPSDTTVINSMAAAYAGMGQNDQALRLLEVAVHRDPESVEIRVNLSQAHERAGALDEALAESVRATELDPGSGPAWLQRGRVHALRDEMSASADAMTRAIERGAGGRGERLMLGQVLLRLERWPEAKQIFEPLSARNPDFPEAWAGLALAEMEQGRLDVAARHVRTARELDPANDLVRTAAGRLQQLRTSR